MASWKKFFEDGWLKCIFMQLLYIVSKWTLEIGMSITFFPWFTWCFRLGYLSIITFTENRRVTPVLRVLWKEIKCSKKKMPWHKTLVLHCTKTDLHGEALLVVSFNLWARRSQSKGRKLGFVASVTSLKVLHLNAKKCIIPCGYNCWEPATGQPKLAPAWSWSTRSLPEIAQGNFSMQSTRVMSYLIWYGGCCTPECNYSSSPSFVTSYVCVPTQAHVKY